MQVYDAWLPESSARLPKGAQPVGSMAALPLPMCRSHGSAEGGNLLCEISMEGISSIRPVCAVDDFLFCANARHHCRRPWQNHAGDDGTVSDRWRGALSSAERSRITLFWSSCRAQTCITSMQAAVELVAVRVDGDPSSL